MTWSGIMLAGFRVPASRENLQRMFLGEEAQFRGDLFLGGLHLDGVELKDMPAVTAYQVIMVRHPACKFVRGAATRETMLHHESATRQQIERRINRRPGDPIAQVVHVNIQFIRTEVPVHDGDTLQNTIAFLRIPVHFLLQKVGEPLLQFFEVDGRRLCGRGVHELIRCGTDTARIYKSKHADKGKVAWRRRATKRRASTLGCPARSCAPPCAMHRRLARLRCIARFRIHRPNTSWRSFVRLCGEDAPP